MKTGLIVAAVATAALTAAGCSSSAHSGTETFTGTTTSTANHPLIPLKATGLFDDTGSIALTVTSRKP